MRFEVEAVVGRKRRRSERKRGGTCDGGLHRWQRASVVVTCGVGVGDLQRERKRVRGG